MNNGNTQFKYETYKWTYYTFIHYLQCYSHLLVNLIMLYNYIDSIRQVTHHQVNCTNSYLLVDPNVSYESFLSRQKV